MGVNGLWQILQPCARPTNLGSLNRKRLAVDASIWIYQFLKAVRDKEGNALRNSHVVGFFRRICKLLWFGILPVFVFDGGAPALKRSTLQARRRRREGRREDAVRTAGKLLAVQMQRIAEDEAEKRRKRSSQLPGGGQVADVAGEDGMAPGEALPGADQLVYAEESHMSQQERLKSRKFTKQDAYHLPDLDHRIDGMGRPEDPRIMSIDELEEYARQFSAGEDINLYDFSKIDFDGDFFKSLPPADRYHILNAARIRSRLRMGLSKEQLDGMFPDRMAFSRFQIERVQERNHLTQRLMLEAGMTGIDLTMGVNARVAGEKDREYILVKNEGAEGGWALGVVSRDKEQGQAHKPIDVDALKFRYDTNQVDSDSERDDNDDDDDMDFQDVPIEGLNRLPKAPASQPAGGPAGDGLEEEADEDSLFMKSYQPLESLTAEPELGNDTKDGTLMADEDEDLNRAIAMSLQNQYGVGVVSQDADEDEDDMFEDVDIPAAPEWKQKAVEVARPIVATSGQMVAHIVNNRSNAAVKASAVPAASTRETAQVSKTSNDDDDDSDSDSELDIRAAMAAAAKKRKLAPPKPAQPAPIRPQIKNPFDGPLPFEKLDWRTSIFEKRPAAAATDKLTAPAPSAGAPSFSASASASTAANAVAAAKAGETGSLEPESEEDDGMAGGFIIEPDDTDIHADSAEEREAMAHEAPGAKDDAAPLPLPPWMVDDTDIRTAIRQQQIYGDEINAQDREMALAEAQMWQRKQESRIVEIESSSDDDSDVEILEVPPPPKPKQVEEEPARQSDEPESPVAAAEEAEPSEHRPPTSGVEAEQQPKPEAMDVAAATPEGNKHPDTDVEAEVVYGPEGRLSSPEMEFEDVVLPERPAGTASRAPEAEPSTAAEEAPVADNGDKAAEKIEDDGLFTGEADDGFEFSDPEEEELLAQMAEEAEEHARFASELNHKTEQENQMVYESELKSLRSQQKKDRRDADEVTQIMVSECQALLRLFGIPYITAPMEAEAQCAELVTLGLVDGIVTDDSDTFLFGGTRVYKNMFNGNKFVECYIGSDFERELSLPREKLIAIAQLLGSDYADGLPGVGPVTAMEILSEFPGPDGLAEFRAWWEDVQSHGRPKEADAGSPFRRKFRKAQATKMFLPVSFPSTAVAEAYLEPEVDRSAEPMQWGVPDLDGLRSFLMATIGWSQERTDDVLVPVIRDMNRREAEGTQSNITRFFTGSVGAGARMTGAEQQRAAATAAAAAQGKAGGPDEFAPRHAPRNKTSASSRRMAAAVSRLKAKTKGADAAVDAAAAKADTTEQQPIQQPRVGRKRKARAPPVVTPRDSADSDADDDDNEYTEGQEKTTSGRRKTTKRRGKRAAT